MYHMLVLDDPPPATTLRIKITVPESRIDTAEDKTKHQPQTGLLDMSDTDWGWSVNLDSRWPKA